MADHDSDIPRNPDQGAVPNPHRGEPRPVADEHTRDAPDADLVRPDQQEDLGPVEGLMHAAATEAATEVTDDPAAEAEADRLGIESEGVESSQIFSLMLATILSLVLAVVGVFWLVGVTADDEQVERDGEAFYPEIVDIRARDTDLLENYGRTEEVYRIKIGDAMALVAGEYAQQQAGGAVPAPLNFRTVYLDPYFDDSGFEPPVPGGSAPVGAEVPAGVAPAVPAEIDDVTQDDGLPEEPEES